MITQHDLLDEVQSVYAELRSATEQYYEAELGLLRAKEQLRVAEVYTEQVNSKIAPNVHSQFQAGIELEAARQEVAHCTIVLDKVKLRMALAELSKEELQLKIALQ